MRWVTTSGRMGGAMGNWARAGAGAVMVAAAAALAVFLVSQGLDKASLWATVIGLPLAAIIAISGVWTTFLAARSLRGSEQQNETPHTADPRDDSRPGVTRSGSIHQDNTRGTAIAHTGSGDIGITGLPTGDSPDEPG